MCCVLVLQAFEAFLAFGWFTAASWMEATSQDNAWAGIVDMTRVGAVWVDTGRLTWIG